MTESAGTALDGRAANEIKGLPLQTKYDKRRDKSIAQ